MAHSYRTTYSAGLVLPSDLQGLELEFSAKQERGERERSTPCAELLTSCFFLMKDYIFKNGLLEKAVPYLDSFPFPYYIVLRNIEALPRTLADLLRQVFNLYLSLMS